MKKIIALILIILMLITACENNTNTPPDNNNQDEYSVKDYFPVTENTKYSYLGEGNEFASYTMYIDYINGNRFQTRTNNGGTETIRVYEFMDDRLVELYSRSETYFREDFTKREFKDGDVILKLPYTGELKQIVTQHGNFDAIEVTTENNNSTSINYYAKDVGLVKSVFKNGNSEVSSTLSDIEQNTPLIQSITLYYPDLDGVNLNSVDVQISFNTNDSAKEVIEKTVRDLSLYELFSTNTKINELYFDENDESVHIDLSKDFIEEMNVGAGYESLILQSIANTLGSYYGVENIYLTIDSDLYESGHISLEENEPLKVDYSIVKK